MPFILSKLRQIKTLNLYNLLNLELLFLRWTVAQETNNNLKVVVSYTFNQIGYAILNLITLTLIRVKRVLC